MRWRGLTALVVLAVVGGLGGYAAADRAEEQSATIASPRPLAATSPSYPVTEYDVRPDPSTPPLRPGIELHEVKLQAGDLWVRAAVPPGWLKVPLLPVPYTSWNFSPRGAPPNTYLLRISLLGTNRESVAVARLSRMAALQDAEANGDSQDLDFEAETEDSFAATFIDGGGYRRVTFERFLPIPGTNTAAVEIAVNGREADREGMEDLLARVVASVELPGG